MTEEYKKFQNVERVFQECTDAAFGNDEKMDLLKRRPSDLKAELMLNSNSTGWETMLMVPYQRMGLIQLEELRYVTQK